MASAPSNLSRMTPKMREIVESISRDREELLRVVQGLEPAQLDFQPSPGAWSISDVLHHLALADDANGRLMSVLLQRARGEERPPDPSPDASVLGSVDALLSRVETGGARAPERVNPRSHLPAAESIEKLQATRARLIETAEALSAFDLSGLTHPHPFFGELDAYQWLLVAGWHERRHRAQIGRIRSSPDFPRRS